MNLELLRNVCSILLEHVIIRCDFPLVFGVVPVINPRINADQDRVRMRCVEGFNAQDVVSAEDANLKVPNRFGCLRNEPYPVCCVLVFDTLKGRHL